MIDIKLLDCGVVLARSGDMKKRKIARGDLSLSRFSLFRLKSDRAIRLSGEAERREINCSADLNGAGNVFKSSRATGDRPCTRDWSVRALTCQEIEDINGILSCIIYQVSIRSSELSANTCGQQHIGYAQVAIIMMQHTQAGIELAHMGRIAGDIVIQQRDGRIAGAGGWG